MNPEQSAKLPVKSFKASRTVKGIAFAASIGVAIGFYIAFNNYKAYTTACSLYFNASSSVNGNPSDEVKYKNGMKNGAVTCTVSMVLLILMIKLMRSMK